MSADDNKPSREILRNWSAELQGYRLKFEIQGFQGRKRWYYIINPAGQLMPKERWRPDDPQAPAWQLLAVITRMRELGFTLTLISGDLTFGGTDRLTGTGALFLKDGVKWSVDDMIRDPDLLMATLRAAFAAYHAGRGEDK